MHDIVYKRRKRRAEVAEEGPRRAHLRLVYSAPDRFALAEGDGRPGPRASTGDTSPGDRPDVP